MIHREGRSGMYVRLSDYEALEKSYYELIMGVARKFDGETRHQTALRYILERESQVSGPSQEVGTLTCPITGVATPQKPADMPTVNLGEWIKGDSPEPKGGLSDAAVQELAKDILGVAENMRKFDEATD